MWLSLARDEHRGKSHLRQSDGVRVVDDIEPSTVSLPTRDLRGDARELDIIGPEVPFVAQERDVSHVDDETSSDLHPPAERHQLIDELPEGLPSDHQRAVLVDHPSVWLVQVEQPLDVTGVDQLRDFFVKLYSLHWNPPFAPSCYGAHQGTGP